MKRTAIIAAVFLAALLANSVERASAAAASVADPMVEARARVGGLLPPGSEGWVNAQRKALEKRQPPAAAPARQPQKPPKPSTRAHPLYLKLTRGDPSARMVALTFDDGPHPEFTSKLLAVLDKYNVRATFFVVGKMAEKCPDLVRKELAAGHEIGNHTYSHANLAKLSESGAAAELKECEDTLREITGEKAKYCRPPGGRYDREAVIAASQMGLTTVLWTDNSADYLGLGERKLQRRVLSRVTPGGIILMHDGVQQTIDVLPAIIEKLRSKGYRFVTLSELQAEAAKRSNPAHTHA